MDTYLYIWCLLLVT